MLFPRRFHTLLVSMVMVVILMVIMVVSQSVDSGRAAASGRAGASSTSTRYTTAKDTNFGSRNLNLVGPKANSWDNFTAITTGSSTTCALNSAGTAYCWGSNAYGQLGIGSTTNSSIPPVAVTMPTGVTFTAIEAGDNYVCLCAYNH